MWFSSWLRKQTVSRKQRPASRFRPTLEMLEDRAVPATFLVNTTADVLGHANGMLSLRQAIIDANATPAADTIVVPAGTYKHSEAGEDCIIHKRFRMKMANFSIVQEEEKARVHAGWVWFSPPASCRLAIIDGA